MESLGRDILTYLVQHYALYIVVVMVVLMSFIIILLDLIKKPIKKLTSKIENQRIRKLANKVLVLLAFGLSALFWAILSAILPKYFGFDGIQILLTGSLAIVVYELSDGVITTNKASKIVETIKEVVNDGKIEKKEVKEIIDDINTSSNTENELDELLK